MRPLFCVSQYSIQTPPGRLERLVSSFAWCFLSKSGVHVHSPQQTLTHTDSILYWPTKYEDVIERESAR